MSFLTHLEINDTSKIIKKITAFLPDYKCKLFSICGQRNKEIIKKILNNHGWNVNITKYENCQEEHNCDGFKYLFNISPKKINHN